MRVMLPWQKDLAETLESLGFTCDPGLTMDVWTKNCLETTGWQARVTMHDESRRDDDEIELEISTCIGMQVKSALLLRWAVTMNLQKASLEGFKALLAKAFKNLADSLVERARTATEAALTGDF